MRRQRVRRVGSGNERRKIWTKQYSSFIAIQEIGVSLVTTKPRLDQVFFACFGLVKSYIPPVTSLSKSVNNVKDVQKNMTQIEEFFEECIG